MANTVYDNFYLSNEIEDQYKSHLDLQTFCTVDNALEGTAGMLRKINVYKATDGTEKLAMGAGNSKSIEVGFTPREYRIQLAQNRFKYYDEQAMTDPQLVPVGTKHMGTDMFNTVNADIYGEFAKATQVVVVTKLNFDAFADAQSVLALEDLEGVTIFAFVSPADVAELRKELKDTLQYVEAFAKNGYTSRQASSNYGIGYDGRIGMYVEEKDRSWCSSNAANDNRAITIEVASDTKEPYAVTAKAYAALIDLLVDICKRNGIKELKWKADKSLIGQPDKQNMTVHRWFANKSCPGTYLYERHAQIASEVNKRLGSTNIKPTPEKPSGGLYRVQTGAFKSKANADAMLAKVKAKGFDTYMVKVGDLYKIQVGAFKVKANAEAALKKLQAAGFSGFITTEQGAGKSVDELAREVLQGKWGNGAERKKRLEAAGYDYAAVQKKVNQLA